MASSSGTAPPRLRRAFRLALVVVVLFTGIWIVVERFVIQIDRYRPQVVEAIEDATGLPASIGRLSLHLLPSPRVIAHRVIVGDWTFEARVAEIVVTARLLPLVRGEVAISSVDLQGAVVRLPTRLSELNQRIVDVVEHATQPSEAESSIEVSIARIATEDATVFWGAEQTSDALISFALGNVLSDEIAIGLSADFPEFGDRAGLKYDMTIERTDGTITNLRGVGDLKQLEISRFAPEGLPEAVLAVRVSLEGSGVEDLVVSVSGLFDTLEEHPLGGSFTGAVMRSAGDVSIPNVHVWSPGLETSGTGSVDEGTVSLHFPLSSVNRDGLDALFAMMPSGAIVPGTDADAEIVARDLVLVYPSDGDPELRSGVIEFRGLELESELEEPLLAEVRGRLNVHDGVIRVAEFLSDALSLEGEIRPDFAAPAVTLDLHGTGDLNRKQLAAFVDAELLEAVEGVLSVDRFSGTFGPGSSVPDDLVIEGRLDIERLDLSLEAGEFALAPMASTFTTDSTGIQTSLSGESGDVGAITVDGRYVFDERVWRGSASANVAETVAALVPEASEETLVSSVLERYGESTFQVEIGLPAEDSEEGFVRIEREGAPTLAAEVVFALPAAGFDLGRIQARTSLPIDGLGSEVFGDVGSVGVAVAEFVRDPAEGRFRITADLSDTSIRVGEYIEKERGDRLQVSVDGSAAESWAAEELEIALLDATIPLRWREDGALEMAADLDLALVAGVLPEGSTAQGSIRAEIVSEPRYAKLAFAGVGFAIDEAIQIDSINGGVEIAEDHLAFDEMTFVGDRTECVLAVARDEGRWEGSLKGDMLDLEWLLALVDAVGALSAEGEGAEPAAAGVSRSIWTDPIEGEFFVHFDKLYYGRGELDALTTRIRARSDSITLEDIFVRPYTGKIAGTIDIVPGSTTDSRVNANLEIDEIDTRIFDEILFEEDREVRGILSGEVHVTAPLADPKAMIAAANGEVTFRATEGSLGKLGFATKLLAALKTVEVINLKVPSLRDEGLTYNTLTGTTQIMDGVMQLGDVVLDGGAYELELDGKIDFPEDKTDVSVNVHALESVSNIVEKVPVVGAVTNLTTDLVGVTVMVSGSPYDIETMVVPGGDNILENTAEFGKDIVKGVADTIKLLIPGGNKDKKEDQE